jgi:hypothetical protein
MLFKVQHGKDVFELNPELKAISEFEPLTGRQMVYVILSTDYKSPFRKLTTADRKTRAAVEAGYKYDKTGKRLDTNGRNIIQGKNAAVEKAIKKYRILQKDEDYESLLGLSKLIGDIRELNQAHNKSLAELEKAVKFSKELPALMKAKKDLEEVLDMREDEITDIGLDGKTEEEETTITNLSILAQLNDEGNEE